MCLYPKLIRNPKYTSNLKNKGIVPVVNDQRVLFVPVGCGKCIECRKQKSRNWQVRLLEEIKKGNKAYFVTLTFSSEEYAKVYKQVEDNKLNAYDTDNKVATYAVRHFLEVWRKHNKKSVRHFLVTELGHQNTEHIHLHGIIWTNNNPRDIEKHWKYGYTWIGDKPTNYVNEQTVNYIIKYVTKIDNEHKEYIPIILCSKGIGDNYITSYNSTNNLYKNNNTNETYKTRTGHKIALPIYYRNKLYNDDQKELLWLHKLDKKERWVLGQRIDISESEDEYYKALEYAQAKNIRLGYGDDKIDWNRREYENERRLLKQVERGALTQEEANIRILQFKHYRKFKENNNL